MPKFSNKTLGISLASLKALLGTASAEVPTTAKTGKVYDFISNDLIRLFLRSQANKNLDFFLSPAYLKRVSNALPYLADRIALNKAIVRSLNTNYTGMGHEVNSEMFPLFINIPNNERAVVSPRIKRGMFMASSPYYPGLHDPANMDYDVSEWDIPRWQLRAVDYNHNLINRAELKNGSRGIRPEEEALLREEAIQEARDGVYDPRVSTGNFSKRFTPRGWKFLVDNILGIGAPVGLGATFYSSEE